jgi:hypothetical protein
MKKIALALETLHVESFETTPRTEHPRGTVHGAGASEDTNCPAVSCGTSCDGTCGDSCHGSCLGETCEFVCTGILTC